jgi:HK97 family phage portal protein
MASGKQTNRAKQPKTKAIKPKVITKSANGVASGNWGDVDFGCDYVDRYTDTSPANIIRKNTNFVNACLNKISQYIGSVPVHTYFYTKQTKRLVTANKALSKAQKSKLATSASIKQKGMDIVEITDIEHPLVTLIQKPCQDYSYPEWIGLISKYLCSMGNCLLEIQKEGETIIGLKPLQWEYIYPQVIQGKINSYSYTNPNDVQQVYKPEQVIHLRLRDIGNTLIGRGLVEACIDSANLFSHYDKYQIALANNYGMPSVALNVNGKYNNKEEAERMAANYQRKFAKGNNGKPIITFGEDVKITALNVSPRDMDFKEGRNWAKKTICATLGVPEDLVDVADSNRASSVTAISSFLNLTILPLLTKILEQINTQVVEQYFDENAFYFHDPSEVIEKDASQQATILNSYVDSGVMSKDEARERLGLETVEVDATEVSTTNVNDTQVNTVDVNGNADAGVTTEVTLNGAQITAAVEVITQFSNHAISDVSAIELLVAVGINRDNAVQMIEAEKNKPKPIEPIQPKEPIATEPNQENV